MAPSVASKADPKKTGDTPPLTPSSEASPSSEVQASKRTTPVTTQAQTPDKSSEMSTEDSQAQDKVHKQVQSDSIRARDRSERGSSNASSRENEHPNAMITTNNIRRHTPNRAPNFQSIAHPVYQNSDRIAIFIDGSNLFYAASHLNIEVDYRRLLTALVGGRRLLRAYFYTGVDPQNEKQRGFLLWLNRHGHRVVSKELAHLPDGSRKANMHVEMAVDMMRISEYCSTLTLLGGDGNLAYALQVLSQRGISLEVVSLQSMTSDSLIDLADVYTDLADLRDKIKR